VAIQKTHKTLKKVDKTEDKVLVFILVVYTTSSQKMDQAYCLINGNSTGVMWIL